MNCHYKQVRRPVSLYQFGVETVEKKVNFSEKSKTKEVLYAFD